MDKGETFRLAEWTIENFTCWNLQLHGNCIESAVPFLSDVKFILYPRGFGGNDDRMVTRVCFSFHSTSSGELSFISSDGSLICTQEVNMEEQMDIELPPGPSFKEVVSQIRMNDDMDRLTLLYKGNSKKNHTEKMHTVIDVFDTTLKLDPDVVGCGREILLIDYSTSKNHDRLFLKSIREGVKTELKLVPSIFKNKNCLVLSFVSLMKSNGVIEMCKNTEHMCVNEVPWTIMDSLNPREMSRKGIALCLRLKIISGVTSTQYFHKLYYVKGTSIVSNDSTSSSKEVSSNSLDSVTSNETGDSVEVLTKDLMCLYQDQDFSDITLKCDNVSFPIHKNILSARSPVFKTMLSTDMKESVSSEVVIRDLEPSTLSLFLTYIYTGTVEELQSERALNLYYMADKYQVPSLKRKCSKFLCDNVSIWNVCDILSLADKYQDHELTTVSHDFILNNYNEVLSSEEWDILKGQEPLLAVNIVTSFAQKNYVGKIK